MNKAEHIARESFQLYPTRFRQHRYPEIAAKNRSKQRQSADVVPLAEIVFERRIRR